MSAEQRRMRDAVSGMAVGTDELSGVSTDELKSRFEEIVEAGLAIQSTDDPAGIPIWRELNRKEDALKKELERRGWAFECWKWVRSERYSSSSSPDSPVSTS